MHFPANFLVFVLYSHRSLVRCNPQPQLKQKYDQASNWKHLCGHSGSYFHTAVEQSSTIFIFFPSSNNNCSCSLHTAWYRKTEDKVQITETMLKLKSMPFYFLNILRWCFCFNCTPCVLLRFRGERHCTRHFRFCHSLSFEAAQRTSSYRGYLQTEANTDHAAPYF